MCRMPLQALYDSRTSFPLCVPVIIEVIVVVPGPRSLLLINSLIVTTVFSVWILLTIGHPVRTFPRLAIRCLLIVP